MSKIEDLANEILQTILNHLADRGDVFRCLFVCRRWSQVAFRTLWRRIKFSIHPHDNPFLDMLIANEQLLVNFQYTESLELNFSAVGPRHVALTELMAGQCLKNLKLLRKICENLPP